MPSSSQYMDKTRQICLVSPGHLGSNPRLVKEADALVEAGYRVHVIAGDSHPDTRFRDASILERARWSSEIIPARPNRATYLQRRLMQTSSRLFFQIGIRSVRMAACAHHLLVPVLTSAAMAFRADLYIGHCLAALPAVVAAGQKHRARIGFDAEDFHSGESEDSGGGRLDNAIARTLEAKLLPQCHHLTAASPLIAKAHQDCYGIKPVPVLNVFPLSEAIDQQAVLETPSFYWFSQTIGPGRGLEEFIEILRGLKCRVQLDLRGHVAEVYSRQLKKKIQDTLIELRLLPPDVPSSMTRNAAGYTAGLGLELRHPVNRNLCLTNKAFTYLLAGVPVILSRTQAQEQLAAELGSACLLLDLEQPENSGRKLAGWLADANVQSKSRAESLRLGRKQYNWDEEKKRFLSRINEVFQSEL